MVTKTCYNKACSSQGKYEDVENGEEACRFHPGGPVFHDALKGWSCCKKRVTDFGAFLAIPGCTAGPHNPEHEPPALPDIKTTCEKEKPDFTKERDPKNYGEENMVSAPPQREQLAAQEADDDEAVEKKFILSPKILNSLKTELAKMEQVEKNRSGQSAVVAVGWPCNRSGCSQTYESEANNATFCTYHPGIPIFHEGMKYWSCCERRTSDFTNFLNQAGCDKAESHEWVHPDEAAQKSKENARYDFHQTPQNITINIYCKGIIPKATTVSVSDRRVDIDFCFGIKRIEMALAVTELWAKVIPSKSKLNIGSTKLELILTKKSKSSWSDLCAVEIGASVFFGMVLKKPSIWPDNSKETENELGITGITEVEISKVEPVKQKDNVEDDFDIDDLVENEWS